MRSLIVLGHSTDRFEAARAADAYRRAESLGRRRYDMRPGVQRETQAASPEGRGLSDGAIVVIGIVVAVMLGVLLGGALAI